jgi:hypothetical protein
MNWQRFAEEYVSWNVVLIILACIALALTFSDAKSAGGAPPLGPIIPIMQGEGGDPEEIKFRVCLRGF